MYIRIEKKNSGLNKGMEICLKYVNKIIWFACHKENQFKVNTVILCTRSKTMLSYFILCKKIITHDIWRKFTGRERRNRKKSIHDKLRKHSYFFMYKILHFFFFCMKVMRSGFTEGKKVIIYNNIYIFK